MRWQRCARNTERRSRRRPRRRPAAYCNGLLQRVPQILQGEAAGAQVETAQPRHGLEPLAHLARQHQAAGLAGESGEALLVVCGETTHFLIYSERGQEVRLRAESAELETGGGAGLREQGEIDPCRDVLQPRMQEGIVVGA